ncbi:MAG: MFS transporter [Dehalococcoidia bacterium]
MIRTATLASRQLLIGVAGGFAISNFIINVAPQAISGLMDSHGFSEVQAGIVNSGEIGAIGVSCMALSSMLNRLDRGRVVAIGVGLLLICNLLAGSVAGFAAVAALRIVAGLGAGLVLAVAGAALVAAADPDRLYAQAALGITLVMTAVIYVVAGLKQSFGYAGLMAAFAALVLVCAIPAIRILPRAHAEIPREHAGLGGVWGAGLLGVIAMLLFSILEGGIWNFAERAALRAGLDGDQIGRLLAASMFSGVVGAAVPVLFGHRMGREWPILLGTALIGCCGWFTYAPPSSLHLVIGIAFFNLGYFLVIPFLFGGCAELDATGRLAATVAGVQVLGGALGPVFAGLVIDGFGYTALANASLLLAALTGLCGTGMALAVRRTRRALLMAEVRS